MLLDACCPPRHTKFFCQLVFLMSRSHESGSARKHPLRRKLASWKLIIRFCQDQPLWKGRDEVGLDKGRSWAVMHWWWRPQPTHRELWNDGGPSEWSWVAVRSFLVQPGKSRLYYFCKYDYIPSSFCKINNGDSMYGFIIIKYTFLTMDKNTNSMNLCVSVISRTILACFSSLRTVISVVCIETHDTVLSMGQRWGPYLMPWMTFTGFVNPRSLCRNLRLWKYVLGTKIWIFIFSEGSVSSPTRSKEPSCKEIQSLPGVASYAALHLLHTHSSGRYLSKTRTWKRQDHAFAFSPYKRYMSVDKRHTVKSENEDTALQVHEQGRETSGLALAERGD